MSDVLKRYSIVIGADTKELMSELNKVEKELVNKLDGKDLGAGVRESIEKLVKEIGTMRSELKTATNDINNSITAISTDSLKNEFKGLQEIISSDIKGLQTKIEDLQGTIDVLNGSDFSKLESGLGKTLSSISSQMDNIMGEFASFNKFTQNLKAGAIDTSALDKSVKQSDKTLKKASSEMRKTFSNLLGRLDTEIVSDIRINGVDESNIKDAEHYLSIMLEIQNVMNRMDSESVLSVLNEENIGIDSESLKKQINIMRSDINNFYADIRDGVQGNTPDIYLRWKTEINPNETAKDIIDKIDKEYTNKVQEHLDKKPLKFKADVDSKDLEDAVKKAIREENNLLKAEDAPKIKVGLEIDGLDKSKLEKVSEDISKKVSDVQSGDLNVTGGNLNLSSDSIAQESTLSDIRDILSGWNGSGIPGTQSKEQIHQNHQTTSNLKNAGYLLHGKFRGRISQEEINTAELREQLLSEQEWLYARMQEMKKLRRIGAKRITNNPNLLKESDLYNASVEVDGVEYAKWGKGTITLADWQAQLDKVLEDGVNDYFKDAVKSIEKQLKAKTENLSLLGIEFDKDGKILARNTVAVGKDEVYKAVYGKAYSLKNQTLKGTVNENGIIENSLQDEKDKLDLLKLQRTTMQQIVELSNKQSSAELSKEEEEKLNALKEQLRTITQICSDEVKFNALLKEEAELQDKMNSNKLDSKGFDRLMSIRQEMSTMWKDVSDDMVEFSRQSLSSTDTQLSQIDNDITQQQTKVNRLISNYRSEFAQIQRESFGNAITNNTDYERIFKQWEKEAHELSVLQNSITKVDANGKTTYDTSALLESERERYYQLSKSVPKLAEQLNLYRELNDVVSNETEKENKRLVTVKNTASETSKIIASIYSHGAGTEQENLSLMSTEELKELSDKLGNVIESTSVNVDENLEQKVHQYIDDRIKYLESSLSYANDKIKQLNEKGSNTSYWEGQKNKIESDLSVLKNSQNQAKTEQEIIESIKTQNKLDDKSLAKVIEILDLTVEIEKSRKRINKLNEVIDSESKTGQNLEISKRKANQERIAENDNLKQLSIARQQLFDSFPYTGDNNDITYILGNLLKDGLDGVPDSLITEFINKRLESAFLKSTIDNVTSTGNTLQSEAQMAASTKERVDAVIKERLEQQKITEEKRKQAELNEIAAKKKESRSASTKNREVNKKYNSSISELESSIDEQSKVLDEAKVNLDKAKKTQERANKNLKKYESFNDYQTQILYYETLKQSKQEELDKANKDIQDTKNRIDNLTKTLKDKSFSETQTEDSVKKALDNAKNALEVQENNLLKLQENNTKDIESYNKIINDINEKRSKSRTKYNKGNIDTDSSFEKLSSLIKSYGSDSFNMKEYIDEVLKYMTSGGDYSKLPQNTSKIISEYINKTKESSSEIVSKAQSIYDSAKQSLEQSKTALRDLNESKEAEKKAIQLYEAEKKYVEALEEQFKIANTSKSKRTEKSDLFSYTNKNSVSKGMSDEQKMASFKVDYQLDSLTKLLKEQEKIKDSAGETSNEYKEISKDIDVAKSRLETFRNEAVDLGLAISQTTGRAFLDASKESVVLYKDMWTGVSESYARTKEQLAEFRSESKAREEDAKEALKNEEELNKRVAEAKYGVAKAEGTAVSEARKAANESKRYLGMTEGEVELTKKLFSENGKLLDMYRKKNDYTQEDIDAQKKVIEGLKEQVEQSERLELYKSSGTVLNARLKNQYSSTTASVSDSDSPISNLPATEKTLVEIKNILSDKLGSKSTSTQQPSEEQYSKENKSIFNKEGYQEVAKSLGLLAKNGTVSKSNRQKVYDEMDRLGVARFIEEETEATKKNAEVKKESKKAIENDTSATKENASEKSKQAKKSESEASAFNAELYKKIAEENDWLTKKGSVQKDKRDFVYLEMEKQQPGSSGKTKEQLEELRKRIEETKVAQKELNKEKQKDTSNVTKKETKEVKKQSEAVKENTKAKKQNNAEKSKGKTKDVETNISSGNTTTSSEVKNNEEVASAIRKKKEELASYELQVEELRYEIEKLSKVETNTAKSGFSSVLSEKQLEAQYDSITNRIFGKYDAKTGKDGSKKWMALDNLSNISENTLNSYRMWQEELQKVGYRLGEIRETSVGLEADILPIDGKAVTNAEEFRRLLSEVSSVPNDNITLLNSQLSELEGKVSSIKAEIKSLESASTTPIKDTFQGDLSKYSKDTLKKYIDGAKAETPEMEKAFKELAEIPKEEVEKALQINSPSEVMRKLGFWTVEGFVVGITENADKVREVLESAIKNGIVTVGELGELSGYIKSRQRNTSYKNIYQGIKGLDVNDLSANQVNEVKAEAQAYQEELQKIIETFNKALADSGLYSMFYVDDKVKSQKDAAQYIKEHTEEIRKAIEEYIRVFAESGLDNSNKTVDDVFGDIFGEKHKTVSNAYSSALKKLTQEVETVSDETSNSINEKLKKEIQKTFKDYEDTLKKLNQVSLNIKNGKFDNKNLQERVELTKKAADLEIKVNKYRQQGYTIEQAGFDIEERIREINNQKEIHEKNLLTTKLKGLDISLAQLQSVPAPNQAFAQHVNQLVGALERLHDFSNRDFLNTEEANEANKLFSSIRSTINELNSLNGKEITTFINQESVKQSLESMQGIQKETIKIYDNGNKISGTIKEANGVSKTLEYTWNNVLGCFTKSNATMTTQLSLWTTLGNEIKKSWNYLRSYFSGYMVAQRFFSSIRTGYTYVRELDKALTEMKKVSDESISSLKNFQVESFNTAKSIGTTAVEIQNSAADFMRLGYSLKEASDLAKDANTYANVGDMEIGEATEHMISSIQAWQSEFANVNEASTAIIDKYNEIGNNYAITSADIGSAMERSAAALKVAGNTLDESIGLITAGNLIQQDADTTANALKVMSLRIRGKLMPPCMVTYALCY